MMYSEDWIPIGFLIALVGCSIVGVGTCAAGCNPDYSEGVRVGTVYKLSNKGLIWKTWEGEMNLGGATSVEGRAAPNVWAFTVVKPELVKPIEDAAEKGYPVKVHYKQWWIEKYPRTESGYEITSVERITP